VPGNTPDIVRKNEVREKLRTLFSHRDCECLVRPLADEERLRRIEEQGWNDLRPEFRFLSQAYTFTLIIKKIMIYSYLSDRASRLLSKKF
jgi:hypothetical protein